MLRPGAQLLLKTTWRSRITRTLGIPIAVRLWAVAAMTAAIK